MDLVGDGNFVGIQVREERGACAAESRASCASCAELRLRYLSQKGAAVVVRADLKTLTTISFILKSF